MKERRGLKKSPAHGGASSSFRDQARPRSSATVAEVGRRGGKAPVVAPGRRRGRRGVAAIYEAVGRHPAARTGFRHSRNETLWNVRLHQSALAPENLITSAHFSVSVAMNLAKSEDEPGNTAAPRSANRAFSFGSARPALISLLSLSTISVGVFLGTPIPCQPLAS